MQGPDRSQSLRHGPAAPGHDLHQRGMDLLLAPPLAVPGTLLQDPARVASIPVIRMELEFHQFLVGKFVEDNRPGLPGLSVADLVDPTGGCFGLVRVALASIRPVADIDTTVRAGAEGHAHEPWVAREHEVLAVAGDVTRTPSPQDVVVDAPPMDVAQEDGVAIPRREGDTKIDQRP